MADQTDSAERYVNNFMDNIVNGLPEFLGAIAILIIGYFLAKAVAAAVHGLLKRANLNQHVTTGKGGNIIQRAVPDPASLVAKVAYWVIFLFAISVAVSVLGIPALVEFVRGIYSYLPNVFAAILIFLVAGAVSAAIVTLVSNTMGDTPTGKVVATASPMVVMGIAAFMILNQLRIAPEIVTITYAALMGSLALGLALAFGLGGRETASRMLNDLYTKSQQNKGRIAADFKQGANRAKQKGNDLQDRV